MDFTFLKEMLTDNQAELLFTAVIAIAFYLIGRFDLLDKRRTPKEKKAKTEPVAQSEKPADIPMATRPGAVQNGNAPERNGNPANMGR